MRNEFSTVRIKAKVPGNMEGQKIAFGLPLIEESANGKITKKVETVWMHIVEWTLEMQFADYKNWALAFGRSNRNANGEYLEVGKSGSVIKTGDGLYAQMETAGTRYYNHFSLDLINDALYELSAAKLDYGNRHFIMRTGERGALQFHKAITEDGQGWLPWQPNNPNVDTVYKANSPLHKNALGIGHQFVEWQAPNGVIVSLEVDPMYDDPVRNKVRHPLGGPAFSYRYDICFAGTQDEPNMFICKVKGKEDLRGFQWGFRNPFTGQVNNDNMSWEEDSAMAHRMSTLGVCVLDPTRTLSIIPAVLQG